jgi:hypothetical protein
VIGHCRDHGVASTYTDLWTEGGEVGEEFCYSHVCLGLLVSFDGEFEYVCMLTTRFAYVVFLMRSRLMFTWNEMLQLTCAFESTARDCEPTSDQG